MGKTCVKGISPKFDTCFTWVYLLFNPSLTQVYFQKKKTGVFKVEKAIGVCIVCLLNLWLQCALISIVFSFLYLIGWGERVGAEVIKGVLF